MHCDTTQLCKSCQRMPPHVPTHVQAGTVVFDGQTTYTSYEQWLADADKHCVPPGTPYSWQPGKLKDRTLQYCFSLGGPGEPWE